MYLLATHIPLHIAGDRVYVENSWLRDIRLARDWLAPGFGPLTLMAPWQEMRENDGELLLEIQPGEIKIVRTFDNRRRARDYWAHDRGFFIRKLRELMPKVQVMHSGLNYLHRPIQQSAHAQALRAGVPTVFVGTDMDIHESREELLANKSVLGRLRVRAYIHLYDRCMRWGGRTADLCLLKEGSVYNRYASFAKNPKAFCHTTYNLGDVISEQTLEQRITRMVSGQPIRLVYCGRLIVRKGVDHAIRILARARAQGAAATFDIIGDGQERQQLEKLVLSEGVAEHVKFLGPLPYGPDLLRKLSSYDGLFFTPVDEDTPRMVYDAYAAGLPTIGYDIPFLRCRAASDQCQELAPVRNVEHAAHLLLGLHHQRHRLAALTHKARAAGLSHAVETWYGRRAAWTREAVQRHHSLSSKR